VRNDAVRPGPEHAAASENPFPVARILQGMPATMEVRCTSAGCELDMFENHYTYDIADDHSVADLACPLCGGTDCLEEIEV
jgi:hypothetical protein